MKSILISIQPKWCALIANGKKTVEIRKTNPRLKTPFKCYIYCTKASKKHQTICGSMVLNSDELYRHPEQGIKYGNSIELMCCNKSYNADNFLNGKVIGEFVCDEINKFTAEFTDGETYEDIRYHYLDEYDEEQEMIVVSNELDNPNNSWICKESCLFFDDFKNYIGINFHDIPFYTWHISDLKIYDRPKSLGEFNHCGENYHFNSVITRPPQSWCYVKSLEE